MNSINTRVAGCLLTIAFFMILSALFMYPIVRGPYTSRLPIPFDAKAWQKDSDGSVRCAMLADLQYRIGLVGKSRGEIDALLGPPEDRDENLSTSAWLLCPSFMDIFILEVEWKNGRVAKAWTRDT